MSIVTTTLNTRSQLNSNFDFTKLFIFENNYKKADFTNSTGGDVVLTIGMLVGKITASGKLLQLKSAAVDGSQLPVGVLAENITVPDTVTVQLTYCVGGHVNENLLVFDGADTLDTVVSAKTLGDRLIGDTLGIYPTPASANTKPDNS